MRSSGDMWEEPSRAPVASADAATPRTGSPPVWKRRGPALRASRLCLLSAKGQAVQLEEEHTYYESGPLALIGERVVADQEMMRRFYNWKEKS